MAHNQQALGRKTRKRAAGNVLVYDIETGSAGPFTLQGDLTGKIYAKPGLGKSSINDMTLTRWKSPDFFKANGLREVTDVLTRWRMEREALEAPAIPLTPPPAPASEDDEDEDDPYDLYGDDEESDVDCDCPSCQRDRANEAAKKKADKVPVEKEKKQRYKKAPVKGLFSKVGVEPTFYPGIDFPDKMVEGEKWTELFNEYVNHFLSYCKDEIEHSWIRNRAYNDSANLEVPTDKEYADEKSLLKDYRKLLRIMTAHGFKPSSVVQPDSDGGCHINFDLTDRFKMYGKDVINTFCSNLVGFMNKYPTSVWGFLHYEDTESSDIYTYYNGDNLYGITKKGMCLNIPNDPDDFNEDNEDDSVYVEMRAFAMPRTTDEFMFHIDFCNKLMKYVWNQTIKKPKEFLYPDMQESYELQKYTWKKAEPEFTKVLNLLGVSVRKAKAFGKFDMIKQRIAKGKTYLS